MRHSRPRSINPLVAPRVRKHGAAWLSPENRERVAHMAVPKRRVSKARQGKRRSHQHLTPRQNTYCGRCGEAVRPHIVCSECGWLNSQAREAVVLEAPKES